MANFPPNATPAEIFQIALHKHQTGDLQGAVELYKRLLQFNPRSAQIYHLLGLVSYQVQDYENAIELITVATDIDDGNAAFFQNLGLAQQAFGQLEEAAESTRRALGLDPNRNDSRNNLGAILEQLGRFDAAEAVLREAIERDPGDIAALNNLAGVLRSAGRLADAETLLRDALAGGSTAGEVLANLGNVLQDLDRPDEAESAFEEAVAARPDLWEAWCNLGALRLKANKLDTAEEAIRKAMDPDRGHWQAYLNLGLVLQAKIRLDEAEQAFRQALRLGDGRPEIAIRLADCLLSGGKMEEAEALLRETLAKSPDDSPAWQALGGALRDQGKMAEAAEALEKGVALAPDSVEAQFALGSLRAAIGEADTAVGHLRRAAELAPEMAKIHSNLLIALQYATAPSRADIAEEHFAWGRRHGRPGPGPAFTERRRDGRKLRVGFVSAYFHFHAAAFFVLPMLESRPREAWEAVLFYNGRSNDEQTAAFRAAADGWFEIADLDDGEMVELVRGQEIDILFDLNGHTAGNRLGAFRQRMAPVQVTWSDYVDTTAVEAIDHFLGDPVHTLPADEAFYTETILRMPRDYICYRAPADAPDVRPRLEAGGEGIVFGCFNTVRKLNDGIVALWADILRRREDSRLLLNSPEFAWQPVRERIATLLGQAGIDAGRLDMRSGGSHHEFLEHYNEIDIALDPFPYSGGLNTCEALWMGVPVVTRRGDRMCGRHAACHLSAVGLKDWIAEDAAGYVALALAKADDRAALLDLKKGLRRRVQGSPLTDAEGFAADFTDLLLKMERAAGDR